MTTDQPVSRLAGMDKDFALTRTPITQIHSSQFAMMPEKDSPRTLTAGLYRAPETPRKVAQAAGHKHENVDTIEPASGPGRIFGQYDKVYRPKQGKSFSKGMASSCNITDRFDGEEAIAYQWGRNRIGFSVHAGSMDFEGVSLRYRLKLQPYKSKKEKCLYNSSWQGVLGSGYNELYRREKDSVREEIKYIRGEVNTRFNTLTGR